MAEYRGEPALGLRERKKLRTRATLMDAAVGLCDRQGFDATTVDQIAAIADVSPRTFSRYFTTKDAVAVALIDEVLDCAARELRDQPRDISNLEALRRAYVQMARNTTCATPGTLTSERLLQILRIVMSSATLRQTAVGYRASKVDVIIADRIGTDVQDRRVRLLAAVWGAVLITAMSDLAQKQTTGIGVDDVVAALEDTCAEFARESAGLGQPV